MVKLLICFKGENNMFEKIKEYWKYIEEFLGDLDCLLDFLLGEFFFIGFTFVCIDYGIEGIDKILLLFFVMMSIKFWNKSFETFRKKQLKKYKDEKKKENIKVDVG